MTRCTQTRLADAAFDPDERGDRRHVLELSRIPLKKTPATCGRFIGHDREMVVTCGEPSRNANGLCDKSSSNFHGWLEKDSIKDKFIRTKILKVLFKFTTFFHIHVAERLAWRGVSSNENID